VTGNCINYHATFLAIRRKYQGIRFWIACF